MLLLEVFLLEYKDEPKTSGKPFRDNKKEPYWMLILERL
jgi:hypothetical protein